MFKLWCERGIRLPLKQRHKGTRKWPIGRGSKIFVFGLMAGKFEKFGLKALSVSCAFTVRIAEAPADHERANEDFRGCSRDDKPVFIEEINK